MRQTIITAATHHPIGEAVWIAAGIIVMFAFGDALTLLALALVTVTMATAWWIDRKVEHRVDRSDAELASATHPRPALTVQRGREKTSAHTSWPGTRAA
jgi:ABC-type bacteriocin/lantibiotic exporter with double-glycine peptidase domain